MWPAARSPAPDDSRCCRDELLKEGADTPVDVVADGPPLGKRLPGRVREIPVEVALARIDRARVTAAHDDDGVGLANGLVGEARGHGSVEVDADLPHRRNDG